MRNMTPQPTDWHRAPKGTKGNCPTCGIPARGAGLHRAVEVEEGEPPTWLKRWKTPARWKHQTVRDEPRKKPGPKPGSDHFAGITEKTRKRVVQAAKLAGAGRSRREIAAELGVTVEAISWYKQKYPNLWADAAESADVVPEQVGIPVKMRKRIAKAAMLVGLGRLQKDVAAELGVSPVTISWYKQKYASLWADATEIAHAEAIRIVREQAGTDAVLAEVDTYLALARGADKAAKRNGEELFPANGKSTLTTLLEDVYIPMRLTDATPGTIEQMRIVVRLWRLITGDPPIEEITSRTLARFRDALSRSMGRKMRRYSPNTIRSKLRVINGLLTKAGPPGRGNRDAIGIIAKVPWVKSPRPDLKIPRIVPPEMISNVYLAAVCMEKPEIDKIKPPQWWKSLIVVAYNTAFRLGTLLEMRFDHIDWERRLAVIPSANMKSNRPHVMPLNDVALDHLRRIRTDRELVFEWPGCRRQIFLWWHKLQTAAAIPKKEHFGFHDLRRTAATMLCQTSLTAAQLALGHTSPLVTMDHYINPHAEVARGLGAMPQPDAFQPNGDGD